MIRSMRRAGFAAVVLAFTLAACGGGSGGGGGLTSTPAQPPLVPPPPPPSPKAQTPFGVTADTVFHTVGDDVEFRWIESAKAYEIRLPNAQWERLTFVASGQNREELYPPSSAYGISLPLGTGFSYTNTALQFENGWGYPIGLFAYGIPTAAGDVPVVGTASYQAAVHGRAGQGADSWAYNIAGTARLNFDFGGAKLSGYFDPVIDNFSGDVRSLGRYEFANTIFSAGSTGFSGNLKLGSLEESGLFQGRFTGPQAAELMAEWAAPYLNPYTQQPGTMTGVWIGKRD